MLIHVVVAISTACNDEQEVSKSESIIEEGAIKKSFSISETDKVYFSQGNLQFQASTGLWRFAENQYDIIGFENENISSTNNGWIDLFCWGTSGWYSGANQYKPWASCRNNPKDFNVGGTICNSLTGAYAKADWGYYNAISNGGNSARMWRTLTKAELTYLIKERPNASKLRGEATVNEVNGIVILPDNWITPSNITFNPDYGYDKNTYTVSEWARMEANGAVFLPSSADRDHGVGKQLINMESIGFQQEMDAMILVIHMRFILTVTIFTTVIVFSVVLGLRYGLCKMWI